MSLDQWQALGIVCGAILAFAGVLLLAAKGLGKLWEWRFGNELKAAMARMEDKLDQHLEWHGDPGGQPARVVQPRSNGGPPRPVPRKR